MAESKCFESTFPREAIIFTVDNYKPSNKFGLEELDSPTEDGEKMRDFIMKNCGFRKKNLTLRKNIDVYTFKTDLGNFITKFRIINFL